MKPFAFVNLSKEDWARPRRARKQLLFEALLRQPMVEEMLYVDPLRHWWNPRSPVASRTSGLRVWQGTFLLPGERFSSVRAINRWYVYRTLCKELVHRTQWHTIFYHPWDVPLARHLLLHGPVLYDWTDDWAVYHNNPAMRAAQDAAIQMASGVLVVTERLGDLATELRRGSEGIFLMPNATAWQPVETVPCDEDISHIPFPRLGYAGHLGPWFDADLVVDLSHARPNWHWVMLGHVDQPTHERLRYCPNVHLLGERPFNTLQAYMAQCQVLVAPYRKNIEVDATKLYDYLTLGLPIVSTKMSTVQRLHPHVRMASGLEWWLRALEEALKEIDPTAYQGRQQASLQHTWDARAAVLLDWLQERDNA